LIKGKLPEGIVLSNYGLLEGRSSLKGSHKFTIRAMDERQRAVEKELVLEVK
jgi:hypothetical protein